MGVLRRHSRSLLAQTAVFAEFVVSYARQCPVPSPLFLLRVGSACSHLLSYVMLARRVAAECALVDVYEVGKAPHTLVRLPLVSTDARWCGT